VLGLACARVTLYLPDGVVGWWRRWRERAGRGETR
jgi:hypothetical protein